MNAHANPTDEKNHIRDCVRDGVCHCGEPLIHFEEHVGEVRAWCPSCYDGAPDSDTRNHQGQGESVDAAVESWAESVDPWPALVRCCICEEWKPESSIMAHTDHGFGEPICPGCES